MPKAMILSVGGTPQPIIKSIIEYAPEFVSFFASQDTCDLVTTIKTETGINFKSEITLVDNVNDLLHCHEKAEEAVLRVTSKGYLKEEVIVDYTGGTKNMSVSLALAAITHGFSFSYVGGKERTKDGVGIVVNGQEEIYQSVNPWDFLAIEEKKKIAAFFNQCQFKAAKELTDTLLERTSKYKLLFKKLGFLIEGYSRWDLFRHNETLDFFKKAKINEIIELGDESMIEFARETEAQIPVLDKIVNEGKRPSHPLILDMYSNAERRFNEGKIDDAILRLYRLVEMLAQNKLLNNYGIDPSDVKTKQIPDKVRADFIAFYKNHRNNKIGIPQTAAYRLLDALGDELGRVFKIKEAEFMKIQFSRNYSYLAHGFDSSRGKTYLNLRDFVVSLKMFNISDAPVFPKMEL